MEGWQQAVLLIFGTMLMGLVGYIFLGPQPSKDKEEEEVKPSAQPLPVFGANFTQEALKELKQARGGKKRGGAKAATKAKEPEPKAEEEEAAPEAEDEPEEAQEAPAPEPVVEVEETKPSTGKGKKKKGAAAAPAAPAAPVAPAAPAPAQKVVATPPSKRPAASAPPAAPTPPPVAELTAEQKAIQNEIRKNQKKLREITDLKAKRTSGEVLTQAQIAKVQGESALVEAIRQGEEALEAALSAPVEKEEVVEVEDTTPQESIGGSAGGSAGEIVQEVIAEDLHFPEEQEQEQEEEVVAEVEDFQPSTKAKKKKNRKARKQSQQDEDEEEEEEAEQEAAAPEEPAAEEVDEEPEEEEAQEEEAQEEEEEAEEAVEEAAEEVEDAEAAEEEEEEEAPEAEAEEEVAAAEEETGDDEQEESDEKEEAPAEEAAEAEAEAEAEAQAEGEAEAEAEAPVKATSAIPKDFERPVHPPTNREKELFKLKKKIREMEELEEKMAAGTKLASNQEAKLLKKPGLLEELSIWENTVEPHTIEWQATVHEIMNPMFGVLLKVDGQSESMTMSAAHMSPPVSTENLGEISARYTKGQELKVRLMRDGKLCTDMSVDEEDFRYQESQAISEALEILKVEDKKKIYEELWEAGTWSAEEFNGTVVSVRDNCMFVRVMAAREVRVSATDMSSKYVFKDPVSKVSKIRRDEVTVGVEVSLRLRWDYRNERVTGSMIVQKGDKKEAEAEEVEA